MGFVESKEAAKPSEAENTIGCKQPTRRRISFGEVKAGMSAKVVAIRSTTPEAMRLQEMGLSIGTEFTVLELAPFGDPVQISLRGYRLCLRRREARSVEVEVVSEAGECRLS